MVAIVGRPNVGKSTLFNRLVGDERAVVHEEPGTTRDAIDTVIDTPEGRLRFVDTAGMRRRSRIDEATEYYGLIRALEAVDRADAALLVIDASAGVTHQDQRLAERIDAAGTAIVVVLNKWDLVRAAGEAAAHREPRRAAVVLHMGADGADLGAHRPRHQPDPAHARLRARSPREPDPDRRPQPADPAGTGAAAPAGAEKAGTRPRSSSPCRTRSTLPTFTLFSNAALQPSSCRFLLEALPRDLGLGPPP